MEISTFLVDLFGGGQGDWDPLRKIQVSMTSVMSSPGAEYDKLDQQHGYWNIDECRPMVMTVVAPTIQPRRRYLEVDASEMAPNEERVRASWDHLSCLRRSEPIKGCAMSPLMGPASHTRLVACSERPRPRRKGVPHLHNEASVSHSERPEFPTRTPTPLSTRFVHPPSRLIERRGPESTCVSCPMSSCPEHRSPLYGSLCAMRGETAARRPLSSHFRPQAFRAG